VNEFLDWGSSKEACMSKSRRTFLLAAGGASLALVGAGGFFVATRRPEKALMPWAQAAMTSSDVRLDAFRHAILAPNPHNRQPWQIRLVGAEEAIITCDLDRRLPHTDPFDRQIVFGFGCFLEIARIAAAERGYKVDMTLFPEGEPQPRLTSAPIARLRFVADTTVAKDPLFAAITTRRSSKVPYDTSRTVDTLTMAKIAQASGAAELTGTSSETQFVAEVRALTWRAWMIEAGTSRTHQESVDLMRIGRAEIEANPDGISLGGALIEALANVGQITRPLLADPKTSAYAAGVDRYRDMLAQTPAYIWITSRGNSRREQIEAGMRYVRTNLAATAAGLAMHPVSQALQEYPEMAGEYTAIHRRLGVAAPGRVQMLARLGFAPKVDAAARWPLEAKLQS
jgi:hypothetical protein